MVLQNCWKSGISKCIVFLICASFSSALYEDQVGKFDWRLENLGEVQHAVFDTSKKSKQLLVASKENVVASLSITTGTIAWRHVLEDKSELIDTIELSSNVLTVSTNHIRKWSTVGGHQLWEIHLQQPAIRGHYVISGDVIAVLASYKVIAYNLKTGVEAWSVDAPWTEFDEAYLGATKDTIYISTLFSQKLHIYVLKDEIIREKATLNLPSSKYSCTGSAGIWLVCYDIDNRVIQYIDISKVSSDSSFIPINPLEHADSPCIRVVGENGLIVQSAADGVYYLLSTSAIQLVKYQGIASVTSTTDAKDVLMTLHSDINGAHGASLHTSVYSMDDGKEIDTYKSSVTTSITARPIKMVPYIYNKAGGSESYRVLIMFGDHTVALIQQSGRVLWAREEALASIGCMEMIDLPVSDVEAQMEEEFGSHASNNVIGQFIGRLFTQFQQLTSFVQHSYHKYVVGLRVVMETADHMTLDEDYLTRDEFSLHKIIVAVSNVGKIYGLDSYTGQVIWSQYVPQLKPFKSSNRLLLYIQRSTAHFPHDPYATVIGRQNCDNCGTLIYSFNPITGEPYTPQPQKLQFDVDQAMLLPKMQQDFIKPIVLLDTVKEVHVYPANSELEGEQELFVFSAQPTSGDIVGLRLYGDHIQSLQAQPTWTVSLGPKILTLKTKEYREQVHSLGKVQADRAVLYKYANPNLVAIISEAESGTEHVTLSVRLLDGVTGRILFACEHKRATGPVHMVHSENWVVYTYYNVKGRRIEIAVLELYEGLSQSNATIFSSLENNISPIVMRQAYILGTSLSALSTTFTERGITGKNILMARTVGGIVEIPKAFLDPRRPLEPTAATKEEGLPPYMPELPLSYEGTINYNQSVFRIRDIHSEPSGLESTSLVVAYGLDVFHTRIAPSKMYDMLKDDFDYFFIGAVTIGMIVISFVSRHFALRKKVQRAWK